MTARLFILLVALAFPLVFAIGYSAFVFLATGDTRFGIELIGEIAALALSATAAAHSLRWLDRHRFEVPGRSATLVVNAMSIVYMVTIAVNLLNADSSGVLSKGGRLDFYFESDWFRRLTTFSTIPAIVAAYHALYGLLSPSCQRQRAYYLCNLFLLFASSLLAGSKGAAVLIAAGAAAYVFSVKRLPMVKIGFAAAVSVILYVSLYLYTTPDRYLALLGIAQRFYLSIDMSILLRDAAAAEVLASRLNDVWLEVFRTSGSFGVRVFEMPIGAAVYLYHFGVPPATGANCRFGSLLLLYPHRIDFLIGFPALVACCALMLREALRRIGLSWSAQVAVPFFIFHAFQDVYWFASHVAPLLLLTGAVCAGRMLKRKAVDRSSDVEQAGDSPVPGRQIA